MATRQYDFIQAIETGSAPTPATPSADGDTISKGYADSNYAKRSSYYDKMASNAAIKAIASADRSTGQVVFNYGTAKFWYFDAASAAADDGATVLQPDSGTGRWLIFSSGGGASGDSLVEEFDTKVSTFKNVESLSDRNACCVEIHNGSGSNEYKIFKADDDLYTRKSFAGFTKAAVSGTANVKTYTISAAYVSGNVVPITINGRTYSVNFTTSSDNTLKLLRDAIAVDPDINTAVVTVIGGNQTGSDDREIVITGSNGINAQAGYVQLNITGTTVTGGASQPTVTVPQNTAAVQNAVDLHIFGPLDGFSGLTAGDQYFLSGTAGAITNTAPSAFPVYVGKALSSTVLFVDPSGVSKAWGGNVVYIRSHGSNTTGNAGAQLDGETFNLTSWAAIPSAATQRHQPLCGNNSYQGSHYSVGGRNTGGSYLSTVEKYNKSSWSSVTSRTTTMSRGAAHAFNNFLYANCGDNSGYQSTVEKWNGSSWSTPTAWATATHSNGNFVANGLLSKMGGYNGSDLTTHETKNTSDTNGSATAMSSGGTASESCSGGVTDTGLVNHVTSLLSPSNVTVALLWSSSAWSSKTSTRSQDGTNHAASSLVGGNVTFHNGGANNAGTLQASSEIFNGSAFVSSTSSSNARSGACASGV
jgi:hypothetical protein